ncbi:hypothetical protein I4U23_008436 [Adineta vaga]|nr:hypothetical protein I4U23_008436 [Adineta vaga]
MAQTSSSSSMNSSSNVNSSVSVLESAIKIEQLNAYVLDFSPENISFTRQLADGINHEADLCYYTCFSTIVDTRNSEINEKEFGPKSLPIKLYSQIVQDNKKSEEYLKKNPDLISEKNLQTLFDWCLNEEIDNNIKRNENIFEFFFNGKHSESNNDHEKHFTFDQYNEKQSNPIVSSNTFYKNEFERELEASHQEIRTRALEIGQTFSKEDEEEKYLIEQGVNLRFDSLALDPLRIHNLNLVAKSSDIHIISADIHIRDKICEIIIPQIADKVTKLIIEPFFMHGIMDAFHFPELYSISLINYIPNIFFEHLTSRMLCRLLTDQITHFTASIYRVTENELDGMEPTIFEAILSRGQQLTNLTLFQHSLRGGYLTFSNRNISNISSLSSTLTNLTIYVEMFDDCLLLVNGCLECLSSLIIRIQEIKLSSSNIDNIEKLLKLKSFSLETRLYTNYYDLQIVPLLRRMLNLEELMLQLPVIRRESAYIDGNHLYDEILHYMLRLKKLMFNIHTHIINNHIKINLPSNDDIRNSFIERGFQSTDACADYRLVRNRGSCHVYSLPYLFNEFLFMGSCFRGGQFNQVRMLTMTDERPFEHKLFELSQDFPVLEELMIANNEPQENKEYDVSGSIIFNHVFSLTLTRVHRDYMIQFLSQRNTCLPCLTHLHIDYKILMTVTNNFTNDEELLNCTKVKVLSAWNLSFHRSQKFELYFPSCQIRYLV